MPTTRKSILLDNGWRYRSTTSSDPSISTWQPSRQFPTEIHLDLLVNKAIPHPFVGKNEELVQWVGEQTWEYALDFEVPRDVFEANYRKATLVFEGLDTFATVKLNGEKILDSNNMFVSHRVEISQNVLVEGAQRLEISFENAEQMGDQDVLRHPEHDWFAFSGGTARLATRKAQYHYGWDWGPKLMTCGPWKPIYLDLYNSRISDTAVHASLAQDLQYADVIVEAEIDGPATHANITLGRNGVAQQTRTVEIHQSIARTVFRVQNPDLWWPFTLGQASLYEINVSLYEKVNESDSNLVDKVTKRFGIRKVDLVQHSFPDQDGSTFFFKINNIPIFAAGSCWIPADSFTSRISAQKYEDWVSLARESNQVMIRVWGGGIYEHEAFYNACDELGVLVWQDFMFACGNFPAHADMRDRVAVEAKQNVRLLRHHPSIVLWCGNNEDYIIPVLRQLEYDANERDPVKILESDFPARYFYEHMLPSICADLIPGTPYWPGSPFGGSMANSQNVGDIHQWHVWHLEMFPYQDFPSLAGRFVSEFGMQALPCLATAKEFFPPGHTIPEGTDFSENEYVKWHNKMDDGGERMAHYGDANIDFETHSLPAYIYSTQLIQSEALSAAYRSWRRLWQGPGKEYCGGALVWQLNDCWPVTSWAIADYYLRPKMAYWTVKRECAPTTTGIARIKEGDRTVALGLWAVNMTLEDVHADVSIQAWDVVTGTTIFQRIVHVHRLLKKNQSTELARLDLDALVPDIFTPTQKDLGYRDIVFATQLVGAPLSRTEAASVEARGKTAVLLGQTINFHEPLREIPFRTRSVDLKLKIVKRGEDIVVQAKTDVPIKGLLVQVKDDPDATWDDNGIDLVPDQVAHLKYIGRSLMVGQDHRLQARWLGGTWGGQVTIRASL